jgi:hypothetical protein
MDNKIVEIAASAMKTSVEEARKYCKEIPEIDAFYFWTPVRGGVAVIVNSKGEKLGATSSVSYDRHLKAFIDGRRN